MNRITAMLVTAGLFAGSMVFAQENGRPRNPNRPGGRPPIMQMNAETARKWSEIQTQLKKQYPEKFAQIEKLAQTNLAEAMQKMTQLAREAKISLPMQRGPRGGFGQRGGRGEDFSGGRGEGFRSGRGEGFGGRGGFGMMGNRQRTEAENQIKEKFPKEYAAIEKTREQAEEQLQALAKKAGVNLPLPQEAMMKKMAAVREKYKAEFEEIRKLYGTDPQAARERTQEIFRREGIEMPMMNFRRPDDNRMNPPPRRGNMNQNIRKKMDQLKQAYPEEMKKVLALRSEDPQKFRTELRKLAARYDREHPAK